VNAVRIKTHQPTMK